MLVLSVWSAHCRRQVDLNPQTFIQHPGVSHAGPANLASELIVDCRLPVRHILQTTTLDAHGLSTCASATRSGCPVERRRCTCSGQDSADPSRASAERTWKTLAPWSETVMRETARDHQSALFTELSQSRVHFGMGRQAHLVTVRRFGTEGPHLITEMFN